MREAMAVTLFGSRVLWRDRMALTVSVLLSLLLGIGLPLMMHRLGVAGGPRVHLGLMAMIATITAFQQAAITLSARRDQLILKRMRATGVGDAAILTGEIVSVALQAVAVLAVIEVSLVLAGVVEAPAQPVLFSALLVSGTLLLAALGAAFTALVPRAELAPVMAMPVFFLTGVGAGGFGPATDLLPDWSARLFELVPGVVLAELLGQAATGGSDYAAAVWTLPCLALGALVLLSGRFRWEPRRS